MTFDNLNINAILKISEKGFHVKIKVRNEKLYIIREPNDRNPFVADEEQDLSDYEFTLVRIVNGIHIELTGESRNKFCSQLSGSGFDLTKRVARIILENKDELNSYVVGLAEEILEKEQWGNENRKWSFLNQMNDWRDTEKSMLTEAYNEKYKQGELIDERWKGDSKVLKVYKIAGTEFYDDIYRDDEEVEVKVLYKKNKKIKETYYTCMDMTTTYYGDKNIQKRREKVYKYKNGELVKCIRATEINFENENYTWDDSDKDISYFYNGKLIKKEYRDEYDTITILYEIGDNKIIYIDINRDDDTSYIISETKKIIYFYDNSTMKEFNVYDDGKLVLKVEFDTYGEETKRIVYDEKWREHSLY